jgi:hypothetical protein
MIKVVPPSILRGSVQRRHAVVFKRIMMSYAQMLSSF